ncbi:hypothetical protein LR48_Vigan09g055400 [Vigna angularis]|uniref:Uncharacterized protein n=1 Tax=Phaseolus angularis TaxID=3914 RepID=A0A0L9V9X5_PHAAN|nr:hypothetical protein LR48_Vigan09g055400 [Vigna angularis]
MVNKVLAPFDDLRQGPITRSMARRIQEELEDMDTTGDTRRSNTIGPITRGMAKKLQDEYSPQGQILFAIFGWKIGEQEDVPNLPKHGEGSSSISATTKFHYFAAAKPQLIPLPAASREPTSTLLMIQFIIPLPSTHTSSGATSSSGIQSLGSASRSN